MRRGSASARARVQSRLNVAAAAAEVFSSVLREVGMAFPPKSWFHDCFFLLFGQVFRGYLGMSTRSAPIGPATNGGLGARFRRCVSATGGRRSRRLARTASRRDP